MGGGLAGELDGGTAGHMLSMCLRPAAAVAYELNEIIPAASRSALVSQAYQQATFEATEKAPETALPVDWHLDLCRHDAVLLVCGCQQA